MGRTSKPRAGSLQFWPRKRAKRIYPRVRSHANVNISGFAGYKVGMTHIIMIDNREHSQTKGQKISSPVTIIECPPLKPLSLRFYKKTVYGLKAITEIFAKNFNKELARKISLPKKTNAKEPKEFDELRLLVYTQPKLTGLAKKKPEVFELYLDIPLEEAKKLLEKDLKASDIFKPGQYVDTHGVTIGKGLQGPVKRFGVQLKSHKSEKKRRSAGNLGAWTPKKVSHTVPQKGQMGFHTRTDYHKQIIAINSDPEQINSKAGFKRYGLVKNEFVLIRGSVPGPSKRLIRFNFTVRNKSDAEAVEIAYVSRR